MAEWMTAEDHLTKRDIEWLGKRLFETVEQIKSRGFENPELENYFEISTKTVAALSVACRNHALAAAINAVDAEELKKLPDGYLEGNFVLGFMAAQRAHIVAKEEGND